MTKDTTRPMTAEEYWKECEYPQHTIMTDEQQHFIFAERYADYRLRFEQEQKSQPLDPFEGAPEWAEWRAADEDGTEWWHEMGPNESHGLWDNQGLVEICPDRRLTYSDWRKSPVKRPARS